MLRWGPRVSIAALAASALVGLGGHAEAPETNHPAPHTGAVQKDRHSRGSEEFAQRWVVLHSIGGNWGRGPTSNGETCSDCHAGHGRGRAPETADGLLVSMVVKLSIPGNDQHGAPLPHPEYGEQLQNQGELGQVPAEGSARIDWRTRDERLADGTLVTLRIPQLEYGQLAFGPLGERTLQSVRIAPALFGAGLLEVIPETALLAIAGEQRARGFNGRPNYVWDVEQQTTVLGRFGWKAGQPHLRQQIASAYLNDMGVTTAMFREDNCPPIQRACRMRPKATLPEQSDLAFGELLQHLRGLDAPVPRRIDDALKVRGERLFAEAQCAACHVPAIRIGTYAAGLAPGDQVIHPYTDLLLHDMGEGLADGRPEYLAGARDWRTPPLWGIGLGAAEGPRSLLHDGRARSVTEAVLWHGGEAHGAREVFRALPAADRAALLAFVESL